MALAADKWIASRSGARTRATPHFVALVFFVSGFPALIYQLTWQRSLFALYGINIEAVTVVVAGFLFGLGIGSLVGGYLSLSRSVPLLALFGAIETSIGAFGVVSLHVFDFVGAYTLTLPRPEITAIVLILLFVPTLLMGSTLPVLVAYLVRRSANIGQAVGVLYCVNTAGSAVACVAVAFGLMHLAGMQGTVNIAAAINFVIGGAALVEAYRTRHCAAADAAVTTPADRKALPDTWPHSRRDFALAVILAGVVGFISLSYEILWFRAFTFANSTASAFALILGVFLAGIANGSLRAQPLFNNPFPKLRAARSVSRALLSASILGFAVLPLTAASVFHGFDYFYPMLVMVFVQTTLLGRIFPVLCHWGIKGDDSSGSRVSKVYLASIIGSVAGTLVTGFVLMDHLSIGAITLLIGEVGIAATVFIALPSLGSATARLRYAVGGGVAAVVLVVVAGPAFDSVYEALTYKAPLKPGQDFTDTVENKSGIINVSRNTVVFGSGVYDGMIDINMLNDENMLIRPISLSLFHPNPKQVLMIGLGTGAWAQIVVNHPSVEHLTVIEINPGYLDIIKRYPAVASLLTNPKVRIVIDDGRRWLNRHPDLRFDTIVQNTTWYYRPNVTNLLSKEYMELLAHHLRDGGIAMYNTTGSARAQRTGCEVYASGFREINVMVVGNQTLRLDPERLRASLRAYRIDGRPLFDMADPRYRAALDALVAKLMPRAGDERRPDGDALESCESILARTAGMAPITDDNMGEEYSFLLRNDPMLDRLYRLLHL